MDLIDKREAAEILGMSIDTLEALMRSRKIPYYRLTRNIIRFDKSDVYAFIRASRVETEEETGPRPRRRREREHECVYYPGMVVVDPRA